PPLPYTPLFRALPLGRLRPLALTIPAVTEDSKPKGESMASTQSPVFRSADLPMRTTGRSAPASILSRARFERGPAPTRQASSAQRSDRRTHISSAPLTTWLLVRTYPSLEMMNPEPRDWA